MDAGKDLKVVYVLVTMTFACMGLAVVTAVREAVGMCSREAYRRELMSGYDRPHPDN